MKNRLAFGLGLVLGAGGAGFLTNLFLKQKYEQKADEEIAACRQAFLDESAKRRAETEKKEAEEKKAAAKEAVKTYAPDEKTAKEIEKVFDKPAPEPEPKTKPPYVIDPDVFDALDNPYRTLGLKYFPKDGVVVADDIFGYKNNTPLTLDQIDNLVGREALTHFGEYEENRVCVRNEALETDFEICDPGVSWNDYLKTKYGKKK